MKLEIYEIPYIIEEIRNSGCRRFMFVVFFFHCPVGLSSPSCFLLSKFPILITFDMNIFYIIFILFLIGNRRALEQHDLYELSYNDSSVGVYNQFSKYWKKQIRKSKIYNTNIENKITDKIDKNKKNSKNMIPSLSIALFFAFGGPFMGAGSLKLVHDTLIFVGPLALNKLIFILNDPTQPLSLGLYYVAAIFLANFLMSICLRQYFW